MHTAQLVVCLRTFIRQVLDLEPVPATLAIPRQGGGKGAGGGGAGAAGFGMGAGAGLGGNPGDEDDLDHHG